jgi:hypothetical protein
MSKDENKPVKLKKVLTDEEKEKRREYNRAYMAKRRLEPEFAERQRVACRKSAHREVAKDREKERNGRRKEYFCLYHLEKKKLVERVRELENNLKTSEI